MVAATRQTFSALQRLLYGMSHLVPITPHERKKEVEGNGFSCLEFLQPPGCAIPKHAHPFPILLFVFAGSAFENLRTRRYEQFPASVILRPAEEEHTHQYGTLGIRCLAVEIGTPALPLVLNEARGLHEYRHTRDGSIFSLGLQLWKEIQRSDTAGPLAIDEIVWTAIGRLLQAPSFMESRAPVWLQRAREIVHESFLDRLTLSTIAQNAGVHPIYLADAYRKHYGSSIGKTIRSLRLNHAIHQLTGTERPITEVAIETGFFDHAHFTKFVRFSTGLTPSQIRRLTKSTAPVQSI